MGKIRLHLLSCVHTGMQHSARQWMRCKTAFILDPVPRGSVYFLALRCVALRRVVSRRVTSLPGVNAALEQLYVSCLYDMLTCITDLLPTTAVAG